MSLRDIPKVPAIGVVHRFAQVEGIASVGPKPCGCPLPDHCHHGLEDRDGLCSWCGGRLDSPALMGAGAGQEAILSAGCQRLGLTPTQTRLVVTALVADSYKSAAWIAGTQEQRVKNLMLTVRRKAGVETNTQLMLELWRAGE